MLLLIPQLVDAPKTKKPEGKELKKNQQKKEESSPRFSSVAIDCIRRGQLNSNNSHHGRRFVFNLIEHCFKIIVTNNHSFP